MSSPTRSSRGPSVRPEVLAASTPIAPTPGPRFVLILASRLGYRNLKEHMLRRLGKRAADGMVSVSSDETRSQIQNRSLATERLAAHPQRGRSSTPPEEADETHRRVATETALAEEATKQREAGASK